MSERLCKLAHPEHRPDCPLCRRDLEARRATHQPPGVMTQALNFAGAVVQHVAGGMKTVSEEEYQARLAVRRGCEFFRDNRCQKCGCKVAGDMIAKARWREQKCPIDKWPKLPEDK
jgi:Family of unknown function (DUF6171)